MTDLDRTIIAELCHVASLRGVELGEVQRDRGLADLGLKSLDLAHLIAALERRLGADPFLKLVPITSVRTVGDLCDAYRRCLEGTWDEA